MTQITRRAFALSAAALPLAACGNGIGSDGAATIDARVDSALNYLYTTYPDTKELASRATGILVMPLITEAGLGFGGSFGRGALRVGGNTVDYYSSTSGSASHVLFFMTPDALADFRASNGWAAGADLEYAIDDEGELLRAETTTYRRDCALVPHLKAPNTHGSFPSLSAREIYARSFSPFGSNGGSARTTPRCGFPKIITSTAVPGLTSFRYPSAKDIPTL